jgi:hypothetical protein
MNCCHLRLNRSKNGLAPFNLKKKGVITKNWSTEAKHRMDWCWGRTWSLLKDRIYVQNVQAMISTTTQMATNERSFIEPEDLHLHSGDIHTQHGFIASCPNPHSFIRIDWAIQRELRECWNKLNYGWKVRVIHCWLQTCENDWSSYVIHSALTWGYTNNDTTHPSAVTVLTALTWAKCALPREKDVYTHNITT